MHPPRLWIRHETRQTERRAPLTPADAARLVASGARVTLEDSAQRVFPSAEYAAAGCHVVPAGSWVSAAAEEFILGLKELPPLPTALTHRHVYFGHAYKDQEGSRELLGRFHAGGGSLLDLEYLVNDEGRRLAAFGYWAGYVGAALAVLRFRGRLDVPLRPTTKDALDAALRYPGDGGLPRVLVIGALGQAGRGATAALATAGITATCWDQAETQDLDSAALLSHDILVNTVGVTRPVPPFLTHATLATPGRRLSLISDVTCDVSSACNALPIYSQVTSWPEPVVRLRDGDTPLDIIAIDNLPSLLPAEASTSFSSQLAPLLAEVCDETSPVWLRCAEAFRGAMRATAIRTESADA